MSKNKLNFNSVRQIKYYDVVFFSQDEVTDFIGNILSSPPLPPPPPAPIENKPKQRVVERKRKISIQDDIYPTKQCKIYSIIKLLFLNSFIN